MSAISTVAAPAVPVAKAHKRLKGPRYMLRILPFQLGFGHIGKFAVIALYYLLFQTMRGQHTTIFNAGITLPDVKGVWDQLLSRSTGQGGLVRLVSQDHWDTYRHLIRNVYEGIFGIFLFKLISWNPYKVHPNKPNLWDRFVMKLKVVPNFYQDHPITPMQYLMVPLIITIASIPGLLIGWGVVQGLHLIAHGAWLSPHLSAHPSFAAKFYAADYDAVIVGLFAGALAGHSYHPVLDSIFKFFARRRVSMDKGFHFYNRWLYPPAYVVYCNELMEDPDSKALAQAALDARNRWVAPMMIMGALVTFALAGFGYYVIAHIA